LVGSLNTAIESAERQNHYRCPLAFLLPDQPLVKKIKPLNSRRFACRTRRCGFSAHTPETESETSPHSFIKLDYPSIVITSSNDPYISVRRAAFLAEQWKFYKYWRERASVPDQNEYGKKDKKFCSRW
jgi:hypothetical protein